MTTDPTASEAARQHAMANPKATPGDSALCIACGLCCDGTLFGEMPLQADDLPLAARGNAPVTDQGGSFTTSLPCGFLHGAVCTVYHSRYRICHDFRCLLLKRHGRGQVDRTAALARIAEAQRLRDAVMDAAAAIDIRGSVQAVRAAIWSWQAEGAPPIGPAQAMVEFRMIVLDTYLARHFARKDRVVPGSIVGAAPTAP